MKYVKKTRTTYVVYDQFSTYLAAHEVFFANEQDAKNYIAKSSLPDKWAIKTEQSVWKHA